jgi:hypothetical protein
MGLPRVTATGILLDSEEKLLSCRISDLGLAIEGTRLEQLIDKVYIELKQAGISFKPKIYLSDEWGCPSNIPVIGVPFYLADSGLMEMESKNTEIEPENEAEVLMYFRHEVGHALNYAYRVYAKLSFRRVFGRFSLPYREDYLTTPFSTRFVRHLPGWYAQKHPDDDFAETFAVWLDPSSDWRHKYQDTPAMDKLLFVEEFVRQYGDKPPAVSGGRRDKPLSQLTITLRQWYNHRKKTKMDILKDIINIDLRTLFPEKEGLPAADILRANKQYLIREVNLWTGINRFVLAALVDELAERLKIMALTAGPQTESLPRISIFIATLAMNYQTRREFIQG